MVKERDNLLHFPFCIIFIININKRPRCILPKKKKKNMPALCTVVEISIGLFNFYKDILFRDKIQNRDLHLALSAENDIKKRSRALLTMSAFRFVDTLKIKYMVVCVIFIYFGNFFFSNSTAVGQVYTRLIQKC